MRELENHIRDGFVRLRRKAGRAKRNFLLLALQKKLSHVGMFNVSQPGGDDTGRNIEYCNQSDWNFGPFTTVCAVR